MLMFVLEKMASCIGIVLESIGLFFLLRNSVGKELECWRTLLLVVE